MLLESPSWHTMETQMFLDFQCVLDDVVFIPLRLVNVHMQHLFADTRIKIIIKDDPSRNYDRPPKAPFLRGLKDSGVPDLDTMTGKSPTL